MEKEPQTNNEELVTVASEDVKEQQQSNETPNDPMDIDEPEAKQQEKKSTPEPVDETKHTTPLVLSHPDIPTTETETPLGTEQQQQQQQRQQDLDAINQLQQLSQVHTQLAQAAAALGGNSNFEFLANFENSIAIAAANSENNTNENNTSSNTNTLSNLGDSNQQQQATNLNQLPTELLKRELMNQKVRADNRERKKRWRQQNEERNKDNDLRCRVNKRAHKLFGKEDSEHKRKWIDEEFLKRQQKRKDKERRKGLVDDSLGGHTEGGIHGANNMDLVAIAHHLNPQNTLALNDANYLTLLCNNLGIPGAARNLLESVHANLMEENNNAEENTPVEQVNTSEIVQEKQEDGKDKATLQPFPFQLLEILQQLQQYQPPHASDTTDGESSTATSDYLTQQQSGFVGMSDKPEEKLAALLASTLQAAAAASSQVKEEEKDKSTTTENTTADQKQPENNNNNTNSNNAEFPMDAVLTLMQLNAGWRQ